LASLLFYAGSYVILKSLRRKETEDEEFLPSSWEDAIVYKVNIDNRGAHIILEQSRDKQ